MTGEVGGGLTASRELAAQIRVVHRRALRSLDRKLWSERGEFLSERRPPSLEARSMTNRDAEVLALASHQSADAACPGQFPAGGTEVRVSVSAHHVRTRAPVWLSAVEVAAWAQSVFGDPGWDEFQVNEGAPLGRSTGTRLRAQPNPARDQGTAGQDQTDRHSRPPGSPRAAAPHTEPRRSPPLLDQILRLGDGVAG